MEQDQEEFFSLCKSDFYPRSQGLANFFCQEPDSVHFWLCRPNDLRQGYASLLLYQHRHYVDKWAYACISIILNLQSKQHTRPGPQLGVCRPLLWELGNCQRLVSREDKTSAVIWKIILGAGVWRRDWRNMLKTPSRQKENKDMSWGQPGTG